MASSRAASRGLGTFGGVFTPSILTILGLILFRRLGFVVGEAGLARALGMLVLATSIALLTSLSLAAIATNRRVRGGGDYYLISRSLGIEYGGALGLVLFAAQAISVAFYCVGFGEGVAELLPRSGWSPSHFAAAAAGVLLVISFLGADLATRFQFGIMAVLAAALVSLFVGGIGAADPARLEASWSGGRGMLGFWPVFAIFFPALTGFTQGVSMSGDLARPSRSLPRGTFLAVGLSFLVYAGAMVVLAAGLPADALAGDYGAMRRVAAAPALIHAGLLAATISSALASFLGAPRILQALAADRVFTALEPFARGHGPMGNPRRAVLLTAAIAFGTIALGNLNAIARVVSMFFLISYGLLNYATYVESTAASPSFRPRFRFFHRRASLAGTGLCAAVMLAIDPRASLFAAAILVALHQYLRRTAIPTPWRDARRAYRFRRVKQGLRELDRDGDPPEDWQPHILVFTDDPERRERVLRFASWIAGGTGMITAVHIVEGEGRSEETRRRTEEAEQTLRAELAERGLDAFALAVAAPDFRVAATTLVQSWGLGPIRANTLLVNWLATIPHGEQSTARLWYNRLLGSAIRLGRHVVALDAGAAEWERLFATAPEARRLDVWWREDESARLALLFAYLMTRTEPWQDATIRLLVPTSAERVDKTRTELGQRCAEYRIDARIEPVVDADAQTIVEYSGDASVLFLPLRIEGMRSLDPFGKPLEDAWMQRLPVVALVAAAGDVKLKDEEDETGRAAGAGGETPAEAAG